MLEHAFYIYSVSIIKSIWDSIFIVERVNFTICDTAISTMSI